MRSLYFERAFTVGFWIGVWKRTPQLHFWVPSKLQPHEAIVQAGSRDRRKGDAFEQNMRQLVTGFLQNTVKYVNKPDILDGFFSSSCRYLTAKKSGKTPKKVQSQSDRRRRERRGGNFRASRPSGEKPPPQKRQMVNRGQSDCWVFLSLVAFRWFKW